MGTPEGIDPALTHGVIDECTKHMAPLGRSATPDDIAKLALFLASDESAYCTGSEFVADGGLVAGYPAPGDGSTL